MTAVDLAVIGGGPGGMAAAVRAAQLGASVAVIERQRLGGLCLHWGCIPTKSFIHVAHWVETARSLGLPSAASGWHADDYGSLVDQKAAIVDRLAQAAEQSLARRGIQWLHGRGTLLDGATVSVGSDRVTARRIVIATGSHPRRHERFPEQAPWLASSDDVLTRRTLPARLLILGGGVSGCEFACLFHALGARVTLVEQRERLLFGEDEEITQRLSAFLQRRGIEVITGADVARVDAGRLPTAHLTTGSTVAADAVLVCIGRRPNVQDLGLDVAGTHLRSDGWIEVNDHFQTTALSVYAIGDVNGLCPLAHAATYQGIAAAEHAMGQAPVVQPSHLMPRCIFTQPEIASVGWTESQARQRGIAVRVSRVPYRAISRAQTGRALEGLIKLVADEANDQLVGAHLLGESATELIGELTLAMQLGVSVTRLADVVHPHPTYSEGVWEAIRQLCGKPLYN